MHFRWSVMGNNVWNHQIGQECPKKRGAVTVHCAFYRPCSDRPPCLSAAQRGLTVMQLLSQCSRTCSWETQAMRHQHFQMSPVVLLCNSPVLSPPLTLYIHPQRCNSSSQHPHSRIQTRVKVAVAPPSCLNCPQCTGSRESATVINTRLRRAPELNTSSSTGKQITKT